MGLAQRELGPHFTTMKHNTTSLTFRFLLLFIRFRVSREGSLWVLGRDTLLVSTSLRKQVGASTLLMLHLLGLQVMLGKSRRPSPRLDPPELVSALTKRGFTTTSTK